MRRAFWRGIRILGIDDHSTQGMSIADAASLLRGKPGDPVLVTVLHQGQEKPAEIKIVRAVIQGETVLGDSRNADGSWNYFLPGYDRIGYLRITSSAMIRRRRLAPHGRVACWTTTRRRGRSSIKRRSGRVAAGRHRSLRFIHPIRRYCFDPRPRRRQVGHLGGDWQRSVHETTHGRARESIQRRRQSDRSRVLAGSS